MPLSAAEKQLLDFHQRYAGAASEVFGRGSLRRGGSGYAWLAEELKAGETVLDLGCGDGEFLRECQHRGAIGIGVDMSAAELEKASRLGVRLIQARAQDLPEGLQVDQVRSHMAFMLMDQVEEVVASIGRVLRPGGHFRAVVGRNGEWGWARELLSPLWERVDSEGIPCRWGDSRSATAEGWSTLFPGWGPVLSEDDTLVSEIPVDQFPVFFRLSFYPAGLLSDASWESLLPTLVPRIRAQDGVVRWEVPVRRLSVCRP